MREKINVLYYPDFQVDYPTLVKAILLFDELHFMDRPSMMFGDFGTIACASPLRKYEESFRKAGVHLFVHGAPMGLVQGDWYERIKIDVNDPEFLKRFQKGLQTSPTFRWQHIAPGNYGKYGDQGAVAQRMTEVDLARDLAPYDNPIALFEDRNAKHFDLSNSTGCAKYLIS